MPDGSREDIESRVPARIDRQELLHGDKPLKLWAIADEAVLRRLVGGQPVMRAQLDHIVEAAELRPELTCPEGHMLVRGIAVPAVLLCNRNVLLCRRGEYLLRVGAGLPGRRRPSPSPRH